MMFVKRFHKAAILCSALCFFSACTDHSRILLTNPPVIVLTADEQNIAWVQQVEDSRVISLQEEDKSVIVAVNGKLYGKAYEAISAVVMSDDGSHIAYTAFTEGSWKLILDGDEASPAFDEILPESIVFSKDGKHLIYAVRTFDGWRIMRDGIPGEQAYDSIGTVRVSSDGQRIAFIAGIGAGQVVVDEDVTGQPFDSVSDLCLSPDGARIAYKAIDAGREFTVVDGIRQKDWDEAGKPVFSSDGKHYAYSVRTGNMSYVLKDGRLGAAYPMQGLIEPIVFGPSDSRIAYAADTGDGWVAVIGGEEQGVHGYILPDSITLSPDGNAYAYVATSGGGWYVVESGRKGPDGSSILMGREPYSDDGSRFAYALQLPTGWHLVADNVIGGELEYQEIGREGGPGFSPDGKYLYFFARNNNEWHLVVNGHEGPAYSRLYKPAFASEGILYLAEQSDKGWLLRCLQKNPKAGQATAAFSSINEVRLSRLTVVPVGEEECVPCKIKKQNMSFEELLNEGKEPKE